MLWNMKKSHPQEMKNLDMKLGVARGEWGNPYLAS